MLRVVRDLFTNPVFILSKVLDRRRRLLHLWDMPDSCRIRKTADEGKIRRADHRLFRDQKGEHATVLATEKPRHNESTAERRIVQENLLRKLQLNFPAVPTVRKVQIVTGSHRMERRNLHTP